MIGQTMINVKPPAPAPDLDLPRRRSSSDPVVARRRGLADSHGRLGGRDDLRFLGNVRLAQHPPPHPEDDARKAKPSSW